MAFDSTTTVTLSNPVFSSTLDDWNLSYTIPSVTLLSTLNDGAVTYILSPPTVTFEVSIPKAYAVTSAFPKPTVNISVAETSVFSSQLSVAKPSLELVVKNPVPYALNQIVPIVSVSFSVSTEGHYILASTIKRPVVSFGASLSGITTKQTWVLNPITGAHSRYTNYEFESFFKLGTKQYGIKSTGIYELTGSKDFAGEVVETKIDSEIHLPISNFGEQPMKACDNAFIYMRSDGEMEVVSITDEEEQREGFIVSYDDRNGMHRRRVKIPKGLLGNAWQYKIKNVDGSNFDINAFEVSLKTLQRVKW